MTCAACANRIEKKLNKIDGVQASVNYATEQASVTAAPGTTVAELIAVVEKAGYGAQPAAEQPAESERAEVLRGRVIGAFTLSIPVLLVSMVPALQFPGWQWVALLLTAVVVYWFGRSFHAAAWTNLRHGATTMDTLVSLGTNAAFAWSLVAMIFGTAGRLDLRHEFSLGLGHADPLGGVYFEGAAAVITFLLLGRFIEARSKREAGSAVRALLAVGAKQANVLRDGTETLVPISQVKVGDVFVVRPGEKIATDGVVVSGQAAVDAAIISGESLPVEVAVGDSVVGGCINTNGVLQVAATAVGATTQLAQIAALVTQAQTGKAKAQRLADRVTQFFVPIVVIIAAVTLVGHWLFGAGLTFGLTAAIAVLVIACPCALGLATPSALLVGTGRGAELGIIIKGPQALERARDVDVILLDKTGTLTTGQMTVSAVDVVADADEAEVISLAASLEAQSQHPVAKAIAAAAEPQPVEAFQEIEGLGVRGSVAGAAVAAGSRRLCQELGVLVPPDLPERIGSQVFVAKDAVLLGVITVADQVADGAGEAVKQLRRLGLQPVMVTGDNQRVAAAVAAELGIESVRADVMPQQKQQVVADFQTIGHRVAMVGDGVNDAAALAQADLGVAMGAGSDAAAAASDLTLMNSDVRSVVDAVRLSRATDTKIRSNLVWAFGYNVAAIPIAALGLLTPMIAGAAMAFSSVFVVLNSLRLRRFTGWREPRG